MDLREAFLTSIIDAPDDDAPRLIFADWLDEQGDPRGEFIRVQCRVARAEPGSAEMADLEERQAELLALHGSKWAAPLFPFTSKGSYRRGFISEVEIDLRTLVERGEEMFRLSPIESIGLRRDEAGHDAQIEEGLLTCPFLPRLRALDISSISLEDDTFESLFLDGPDLAGLNRLVVGDGNSNLSSARALAEAYDLTNLRELYFCGEEESDLGDEGLELLADAPHLGSLRILHFYNNLIGAAGAQVLAASKHLDRLEHLYFGSGSYNANRIGPAGAVALAASPNLRRLASLSLPYNRVGDTGVVALAGSPHLRGLTHLDLRMNDTTDAGATALASSPVVANLRFLDLQHNRIGTGGMVALARSPHLRELRTLYLQGNAVGDEGVRALADSPVLQTVTHLDLRQAGLGDAGLEALAASEHAGGLTALWLFSNRITSLGVKALAASPRLAGLTDLDLSSNPIDGEGVRAILDSPHLRRLDKLGVYFPGLPPEMRDELRERFGDRVTM